MFSFEFKKDSNMGKLVFRGEIDYIDTEYKCITIVYQMQINGQKFEGYGDFHGKDNILRFPPYSEIKIAGKEIHGIALPDNITKQLTDILNLYLQKAQEKFIYSFKNSLCLSYYWGDYYYPLGFWANNELATDKLIDELGVAWTTKEAVNIAEKYFSFEPRYTAEEIEKVKQDIESKGFTVKIRPKEDEDDTYYISEVIAPLSVWKEKVFLPHIKNREQKLQELRNKALEKAKATGKPQIVRTLGYIDGDNPREVKEFCPHLSGIPSLGLITIYEVIEPNGTIKEEYVPSY